MRGITRRAALLVVAFVGMLAVATALVASAAGAAPKLRSCGLNGNSLVSASRNVSCNTAFRVDDEADSAHGCARGVVCRVGGYACRERLIGKYSIDVTCTRRDATIVIKGGA